MWLYDLALAFGTFSALVAHELGHLMVARAFGVNALSVTIGAGPTVAQFTDGRGTRWKLGILLFGAACGFPRETARTSICNISPTRQAITLLAGPLSNVILAVGLFLVTYIQDNRFSIARLGKAEASLTFLIGGFSLALAAFNLLPVLPLDGGRLALLAFEALTGRAVSRESEKRLSTSGLALLSIAAALTVLLFIVAPSLWGLA